MSFGPVYLNKNSKDILKQTVFVSFAQGSPGFGIPGQPGPKGENGERVSHTLFLCCSLTAWNYS